MTAALGLMLAQLAAADAPAPPAADGRFDPARHVDVAVGAFTAMPERFVLCVGAHPARSVELDVCAAGDVGMFSLSTHAAWRWRWTWRHGAERGLTLGAGPEVGARVATYCPYSTCAVAGGPELLATVEAVEWLTRGFGLTLQVDGGVAMLWTKAAGNVTELMLRFPARLMVGVAF